MKPTRRYEHNSLGTMGIGRIGEEAVISHLTSKGWSDIRLNTHDSNLTDIEARNPSGELQLLYVKTAVSPFDPSDLSNVEKAAIKTRAAISRGLSLRA